MKCLYCQRRTKVSYPLGGGTYRYCLKCFGSPGLTEWNPDTYETSDKESFFRIDFIFNIEEKKFLIFFYPNTHIIQIYLVNEIKPFLSFTIPNIVEPSNIKSITQRLLNLKAFL